MQMQLPEGPLALRENAPLRLTRGRGGEIRAVSGMVWVTAEGLGDDVFLGAGEIFPIATNGLVLVEAVGSASVSIVAPAKRPAARIRDIAERVAGETAGRWSG